MHIVIEYFYNLMFPSPFCLIDALCYAHRHQNDFNLKTEQPTANGHDIRQRSLRQAGKGNGCDKSAIKSNNRTDFNADGAKNEMMEIYG